MSPAVLIALGAVLLIAFLAAARRRGPRVTHIETRHERRDGQGE